MNNSDNREIELIGIDLDFEEESENIVSTQMDLNIVFEDEHIIVAYKPAGIATQTARLGQQDMVSELKNYLARKPENKGKGAPYLGLVHRLDQPVAGILVFAKTKQAAASLSKQITDGTFHKYYKYLHYYK